MRTPIEAAQRAVRDEIARLMIQRYLGAPIERLPASMVHELSGVGSSITLLAFYETERRQQRLGGRLRLVAANGGLTRAGQRHLRALRAARTRAARRGAS